MNQEPSDRQTTPRRPCEGIRVLVLDDEPALRDVVRRSLEQAGCSSVATAADGCEGLQILLSQPFDVVISDLMMEPMDGITFITEALRIWPWLGVVVFSGYVQPAVREKAEELGITVILEKPISHRDLIEGVVTESRRARNRLQDSEHDSLARIQYQLSLLREISLAAVESTSLQEALQSLAAGFSSITPNLATAILSFENGDALLAISLSTIVTPAFVANLQQVICQRYELLTAEKIQKLPQLELQGPEPSEDGIRPTETVFAVPVIAGGAIRGMLALAPPPGDTPGQADMSLLYHAASHLSTVLMALHRIGELAVRDGLTGLFNRRHLSDELESAWHLGLRYGFRTGIIIIDVDHFKTINDTYGHQAGDNVLREIATLAQEHCRASDIVARYGGDEFVMVLPDARPESLRALAERLIARVRDHVFCKGTHNLHGTVSIGAVCRSSTSDGAANHDILLSQADQALYEAKRAGRDRYAIWSAQQRPVTPDDAVEAPAEANAPEATGSKGWATSPSRRGCIAVVDDDTAVLKILHLLIKNAGFDVETFETGTAIRERVAQQDNIFDVALIDLNLADESGLALLSDLETSDPDLVKIVITGDATLKNAVESLRVGAYDFIQKPVQREQLVVTLKRAVEYRQLRSENRQYQHHLEDMVRQQSRELNQSLEHLRESFNFTLEALAALLDARERATAQHSLRVQSVSQLLGAKLELETRQLETLRHGALLHDIGKIAIPDSILLKPDKLDDDQWRIMRTHPEVAYRILGRNEDLKDVAELIYSHHEWYDGAGYPRGLAGSAICIGARVFTVVDSYDAMRSDRPYRSHMTREASCEELQRGAGTQFDPAVVSTFIDHIDEMEKLGGWDQQQED